MKFLTFSVFILLILSSSGQTNNNKQIQTFKKGVQTKDTSTYAILKFSKIDTWLFKDIQPVSLSENEIQEIEIILKRCIDMYNSSQQSFFDSISKTHPEYNLKVQDFVINLYRYKRQYFPVINSSGEKEVWVNFFCDDFDKNWRKEMLIVQDGGNCYFSLIINLTTKSYYRFIVNGDA